MKPPPTGSPRFMLRRKKTWLAEFKPEDADGGELDVAGRVMEMLSEHTLEGWF